jgi:hypothetical protein
LVKRKVVPDPSERRTTGDQAGRQLHAGVEGGDGEVVPVLDLAEVDVGQQRAGELRAARGEPLDVHHRHDATDDRRELDHAVRLELLGLEGHVGGTEVDRLGADLLDAAAGSDRLVVERHVRLRLVGLGPLGVGRIGEGRACTGDVRGLHQGAARVSAAAAANRRAVSKNFMAFRCLSVSLRRRCPRLAV